MNLLLIFISENIFQDMKEKQQQAFRLSQQENRFLAQILFLEIRKAEQATTIRKEKKIVGAPEFAKIFV